jgi:mono/diheme cytochrome c family protein
MTNRAALLSFSLLAACADAPDGDCAAATQHVTDCYGDEIGAAFGQSCTADTATTALSESCPGADGTGKEDLFATTPVLSPPIEQFKYGSIGGDIMGVPLSILKAVPLVCADTLPPGANPRQRPLEAFGMIYEPGKDIPIGFSQRRLPIVGITLTGTTCSTCHTATVRETAGGPRTAYFGAPNTRFDVQGFNTFLLECIQDTKRFNSTTLDRAFRELGVTGMDRFLAYSSGVLRAFTATLKAQVDSVVTDGPWGPGRDDAIGLSAAILLGDQFLPTIPAPIDYPSVWNGNARKGHALHWDGAAGTALERNVLVAVGAGTPKDKVPLASINAIQSFLDNLPAPKYPFAIDPQLAARGKPLFDAKCLSCHGGARTFEVIDLFEVKTDPNRLLVVSQEGIDKINSMSGRGWTFDSFRKTNGYLTGPLDGIWLRSPYLHNGSVPTLRDLLKPASQRPTVFFRGNDVFDKANVGYVSTVASDGAKPFEARDGPRGNGNGATNTEPISRRRM